MKCKPKSPAADIAGLASSSLNMNATTSSFPGLPIEITDPINAKILAVSEDRIQGFHARPFEEIARLSGVALPVVLERIGAMQAGGTIRRVRQTLMATNLAHGALVAWEVSPDKLDSAFNTMFQDDPFSGHVVIRSTDVATPGSTYRLWTTLKTPQGYDIDKHCQYLRDRVGADHYRIMPAKRLFALGVGHMRRRTIEPGSRSEELATVIEPRIVKLTGEEWLVLMALKREFEVHEIALDPWRGRAAEAGVDFDRFIEIAQSLQARGVIGRFSTFLEHVKPLADGQRVTRFNALFHWAVPEGRELEAGREVGRHHILTHAYWREGGAAFRHVNIMAVAHGLDKQLVLQHKAAIDEHLKEAQIPVNYTNVFWGGRSEIKPSEISPIVYRQWCASVGLDEKDMRLAPADA